MKKTAIFIILAMMALLVVAGCNTQAQQNQQKDYYVPYAGGCGVSAPITEGTSFPVIAEKVTSNEFF